MLFCGFFAIVQAMNGRFEVAAIAIFVAMVLDGMDGRVARWTNTQSEFGAQYDSIADMVAFGAAPALIAYEWALKDLGTAGWIGAFIYCAGTGIRLARFNANIAVVDKRYFQGLPSPAAAAVMAGFIWVVHDSKIPLDDWGCSGSRPSSRCSPASPWCPTCRSGASRKSIAAARAVLGLLLIVLSFVLVSFDPRSCCSCCSVLRLSGYVMWAMGKRARPRP